MASQEVAPMSQALATLMRTVDLEHAGLQAVLSRIAQTAARTLGVARVNIWLLRSDPPALHCMAAYDSSTDSSELEPMLLATDSPSYFAALGELRNITAFDAATDPRTSELRASYLEPRGIGTLLDVPVLRSGKVVGVVCHEHVGPPREFDPSERSFAGGVGDLVALVLETNDRIRVERERARLTARLAQMQQLEKIGVLASGLAHDFRNLLHVVYANADYLLGKLPPGELTQVAENIFQASERANELCTRLLAVNKDEPPRSAKPLDAYALCAEVVALVAPRVPEKCELNVIGAPGQTFIFGDETEVRQVLFNLVLNALDAMSGRTGKVTVRVKHDEPGKLNGVFSDFRAEPQKLVLIEVEDTGAGIAPSQLDRIFEPFFTTKSDGHGLGLTSVVGVMRSAGGALQVESVLNLGTVFRAWFPAVPTETSPESADTVRKM